MVYNGWQFHRLGVQYKISTSINMFVKKEKHQEKRQFQFPRHNSLQLLYSLMHDRGSLLNITSDSERFYLFSDLNILDLLENSSILSSWFDKLISLLCPILHRAKLQ